MGKSEDLSEDVRNTIEEEGGPPLNYQLDNSNVFNHQFGL